MELRSNEIKQKIMGCKPVISTYLVIYVNDNDLKYTISIGL